MRSLKLLSLAALAAALPVATLSPASAQISVNIGAAPVCPYGYYDVAPYNCAPYGYYGPEWFNGGVFVGAGPWFHGPAHFHGSVDNHFDPSHGYHGPTPQRNEHSTHPAPAMANFHGNESRDGMGHVAPGGGDHGGGGHH